MNLYIKILQACIISCVCMILSFAHAHDHLAEHACKLTAYEGSSYVPERLKPAMDRIAKAYCEQKATAEIIVTSGVRTPEHQARLMQNCLSQQACGYYANSEAASELQITYNAATTANKIKAVAAKISEQVNRKNPCYISKHLTAYALDLERRVNGTSNDCQNDLTGNDLILSQVLNNSTDVDNITYKESSGCTHFHVNFAGWREIAGLKHCPKSDLKATLQE